jgi:hypothetical protein
MKTISVRIKDKAMETRLEKLAAEHSLSDNMVVQMLIGYAFNQIDESGKTFKPLVIFSEDV